MTAAPFAVGDRVVQAGTQKPVGVVESITRSLGRTVDADVAWYVTVKWPARRGDRSLLTHHHQHLRRAGAED